MAQRQYFAGRAANVRQRLLFGDCLKLMAKIPDKSVDLVLCDPPYGKTALAWDKALSFEDMWREYDRICRGPVVLFAMQPFTSMLVQSNLKDFRYTLVYPKGKGSNPLLASKQPMRSHEDICVFYKKQPVYNPQMTEGKAYKSPRTGGGRTNSIVGAKGDAIRFKQATKDTSKRFPLSVLPVFPIHCGSKLHPTQKPAGLLAWLVRTYTNEGGVVLDTCMGVGSTGEACKMTGREFIGMENNARYFEIAKRRLK